MFGSSSLAIANIISSSAKAVAHPLQNGGQITLEGREDAVNDICLIMFHQKLRLFITNVFVIIYSSTILLGSDECFRVKTRELQEYHLYR